MGLTLTNKAIDKYFAILSNLDSDSKRALIKKLEESIAEDVDDSSDLSDLFGAWVDDRDSDEIIKEIREARVDKNNMIEF